MAGNWNPTKDSFEGLLSWLDPDREEAARTYERIRLRLIKYFVCNSCGDDAEDLADRTIDRVMRKLTSAEVPEPYAGDKTFYFLAFASNLRHEYFRERKPCELPLPVTDSDVVEEEDACLEECMQRLDQEERWLAIEYYRFEKAEKIKQRRKLAAQVALSLAGLRTRMHRIREEIRPCIEECLARSAAH